MEMYSDGKCERYDKEMCEDVQGRDARDGTEKICRCTEVKMQEIEQKREICKASCPGLLIVLLEVTCVDQLRLLNLVHVLKN